MTYWEGLEAWRNLYTSLLDMLYRVYVLKSFPPEIWYITEYEWLIQYQVILKTYIPCTDYQCIYSPLAPIPALLITCVIWQGEQHIQSTGHQAHWFLSYRLFFQRKVSQLICFRMTEAEISQEWLIQSG